MCNQSCVKIEKLNQFLNEVFYNRCGVFTRDYSKCLSPVVKEISELLNTGLDDETLKICVQLIEAGINPEALATVVLELRRETAAIMVSTN